MAAIMEICLVLFIEPSGVVLATNLGVLNSKHSLIGDTIQVFGVVIMHWVCRSILKVPIRKLTMGSFLIEGAAHLLGDAHSLGVMLTCWG